MDTTNPYFSRAEVAHRHEQVRKSFRGISRRKRGQTSETRPLGKPLEADGAW